jgi:hypothetical protein
MILSQGFRSVGGTVVFHYAPIVEHFIVHFTVLCDDGRFMDENHD